MIVQIHKQALSHSFSRNQGFDAKLIYVPRDDGKDKIRVLGRHGRRDGDTAKMRELVEWMWSV
jgi:hypothetical protein